MKFNCLNDVLFHDFIKLGCVLASMWYSGRRGRQSPHGTVISVSECSLAAAGHSLVSGARACVRARFFTPHTHTHTRARHASQLHRLSSPRHHARRTLHARRQTLHPYPLRLFQLLILPKLSLVLNSN
ncbi:unnamed protein product [Chrysodeixis includens]|uniref:Uncharacterized protein n=1 Tax=Chrysodeixis includens TaxID=689277 RepID=A0A9N8KWC3_CHRIL|nr:unnamed protein product [Chrysodeixis includens]